MRDPSPGTFGQDQKKNKRKEECEITPELQQKIDHSIAVLRKAEKIALLYNDRGFYLAFSGGKDSQALYHIAKMAGVKFEANMNLTSIDPPEVIRFVKRNYPDVILHAPKKSIYQLAIEHKILPSRIKRWCCEDLKEGGGAGMVVLIGIRHAESTRRAKRSEVEMRTRKFSGDMEGFEEYREKAGYTETTTGCIKGKDSLLISPIINWTEEDVWAFLNEVVRVPHCELYDQGIHRIGCIACPMSNLKTKQKELERWPHVKERWLWAIRGIQKARGDKFNRVFSQHTPEEVFDWWISGLGYDDWVMEKKVEEFNRRQTEIDFGNSEDSAK